MQHCLCWVAWVLRGVPSCSSTAGGVTAKCPPPCGCSMEVSDWSQIRTKFCCSQRFISPLPCPHPLSLLEKSRTFGGLTWTKCWCYNPLSHLTVALPLPASVASISWSCLVSEASQNTVLLVPGSQRLFVSGSDIENLLLPVKSRMYAEFLCLCPSAGAATGSNGCSHLMWWLRLRLRAEAAGFRPAPCRIMNCHASADYLTSLYNV